MAAEELIDNDEELEELEEEDHQESQVKEVEAQTVLTRLLADPDIQKVVRARQAGKALKIIEDAGEEELQDAKDELEDLQEVMDDDDPAAALVKKMLGTIEKRLDAKLGPLTERLSAIEGVASTVQKNEISTQVKRAKQKYPDLEEYKSQMLQLSETFPDADVEELYLLAKKRSGKSFASPKPFSEKPTTQPRPRKTTKTNSRQDSPRGRQGFTSVLNDALNELDLE